VNFLARDSSGWSIRTFERGVEAETLACGTGAAAAALLLSAWGLAGQAVQFQTRSGSILEVGLPADRPDDRFESRFRLRGAARIVFRGRLGELPI
jgi:diaminopimelate epimerase